MSLIENHITEFYVLHNNCFLINPLVPSIICTSRRYFSLIFHRHPSEHHQLSFGQKHNTHANRFDRSSKPCLGGLASRGFWRFVWSSYDHSSYIRVSICVIFSKKQYCFMTKNMDSIRFMMEISITK